MYIIYTRVVLELFIAIFRIMETNFELVALQRQQASRGRACPDVPAVAAGRRAAVAPARRPARAAPAPVALAAEPRPPTA